MGDNNSSSSGPGFFTGLVLGGVIGFVGGMLLAPKLQEARNKRATAASEDDKDWRDKAEELATDSRERVASSGAARRSNARARTDGAARENEAEGA